MLYLAVYPTRMILNERRRCYLRETRETLLGVKLEDLGTDAWWETAEKAWSQLDEWMKTNGDEEDGLIMIDEVYFADVQIVSILVWGRNTTSVESEGQSRICTWNEGK
ncbi:hypothetical protein NM688_g8731 [Phlebia brevispora]|uniref:Uncharacterized protein n=1 Tax=Phlebia brevispora TaxID=194682 RepID=A0ACC1RQB5_9APHY|nr:hypothetical protein NM688_g8731 [Phlebia brevispora]